VQPLHDNHDAAILLAVEAAAQRVVVPLVHSIAGHVGDGLVRFQRIVNDNDIGTATGQHASNRGRHAESAFLGRKVVESCLTQARSKDVAIEGRRHDRSAVPREFIREVLPVGSADDLRGRVVPQEVGWQAYRPADRLQVAGWNGDDQPLDFTATDGVELLGHHLQVPVRLEGHAGVKFKRGPVGKGIKVRTEDRPVLFRGNIGHGSAPCWRIRWITSAMTSRSESESSCGMVDGSDASAL
jgi:hypothetical protein